MSSRIDVLRVAMIALACSRNEPGSRASDTSKVAPEREPAAQSPLQLELEALAPPTSAPSQTPNLLVGSQSVLYASWVEDDGGPKPTLEVASYREGKWSEPVRIAEHADMFVNWADFPAVVELEPGHLLAHWLRMRNRGPYDYEVQLVSSEDAGTSWKAIGRAHADQDPGEHGFVSIVAEPAGGFSAFWLDGREIVDGQDGDTKLVARTTDPDGQAGDLTILDPRVCDCCKTDAAMTPEGPVVIYRDRSADEIRDIAMVRRTANGWTQPSVVQADDWKIAACPVNGPAIAANGGFVVAAWFTGENDRVYLTTSSDGGATLSRPIVVSDAALGRVDLAIARDGHAVVTWMESDAATPGRAWVLARRVLAGNELGVVHRVAATSSDRLSGFPRVVALEDQLVWAWTEVDPAGNPQVRIGRARELS